MRLLVLGVALALAPSLALGAGAGERTVYRLTPPYPVAAVMGDGRGAIVELSGPSGPIYNHVELAGQTLRLRPLAAHRPPALQRRAGMLPDGLITRGGRDIAAAWLFGPTTRYGHGVLGDAVEAEGMRAERHDGRVLSFTLPPDSVFEDRQVRLADLDGDGGDELLAVRAYLDRGAALAVLRAQGDRLALIAETPPIGLPHRWLNPAAVADFDGDGRAEVALVVTPHIGGILKIYELRGGRLVEEWSGGGFSNHAMGSRILDMAVVVRMAGTPILVLPDARRQGLRRVTFQAGAYRVADIVRHRQAIVTALRNADLDGDGVDEVVYGLAGGDLIVARAITDLGKTP